MTQDEIIRMAREAGDEDKVDPIINDGQWITFTLEELERFAALVAEATKEKAAKVCAAQFSQLCPYSYYNEAVTKCAAAIRSMK